MIYLTPKALPSFELLLDDVGAPRAAAAYLGVCKRSIRRWQAFRECAAAVAAGVVLGVSLGAVCDRVRGAQRCNDVRGVGAVLARRTAGAGDAQALATADHD